tara:strand:- start:481 stop:699 length:219 start_codon:yes stop_codon:yes gene_type:complete
MNFHWTDKLFPTEVLNAFTETLRDAISFNEEISFDKFSDDWWKQENFFMGLYSDMKMKTTASVKHIYYEDGF